MSTVSLRPIMVDYLKTITAVTDNVKSKNITDIEYNFEDFGSSSANSVSAFPAISVQTQWMNLKDTVDSQSINLFTETLDIQIYQQVSQQKLKARSLSVRNKETTKLRVLDTIRQAVVDELRSLRGSVNSQIEVVLTNLGTLQDNTFTTDSNKKIYQVFLSFNITYKII